MSHDDPGPMGWQCDSTVTYIERGIVSSLRLGEIKGARNEHLLFRRSPSGRYSDSEWRAFQQSIASQGVLNPIILVVDGAGHKTVFEGNHRVRAALAHSLTVPVEIRYDCNAQLQELALPEVQRIALPIQVRRYAELASGVRFLRGKRQRTRQLAAARCLLELPEELRRLAVSVARAEGADTVAGV